MQTSAKPCYQPCPVKISVIFFLDLNIFSGEKQYGTCFTRNRSLMGKQQAASPNQENSFNGIGLATVQVNPCVSETDWPRNPTLPRPDARDIGPSENLAATQP
ncbi:hypothetical protein NFI96_025012 [Prochilodus magdalenae]|nr:hypothetical protein NFI96_025012 [Prochilodus magdalenae]